MEPGVLQQGKSESKNSNRYFFSKALKSYKVDLN